MLAVIDRPDDLDRICRELVEEEARAGVVYLEPSINPTFWAERFRISASKALAVISEASADAGRHGVDVALMLGCPRDFGVDLVEAIAAFAPSTRTPASSRSASATPSRRTLIVATDAHAP